MVVGTTGTRIPIIFGCALSLLIMSAVDPAAWACPILMEQSTTARPFNFVSSPIKTGCIWAQDEQAPSAIESKLGLLDGLNMADISVAEFQIIDNSMTGTPPQHFVTITGLDLNSLTHSEHVLVRHHAYDDGHASDVDTSVAMYYAIYDINSDLARDLLASYRTISQVGGDISAAMEGALNTIRFSKDIAIAQINATSTEIANTNPRIKDTPNRSDIDLIVSWMHFLLSTDALPYYVFLSSAFIIFAALGTRSRRS